MITKFIELIYAEYLELTKKCPAPPWSRYQLSDYLMSTLAMFVLRPSDLFRFEIKWMSQPSFHLSAKRLFKFLAVPNDTTIWRRLGQV